MPEIIGTWSPPLPLPPRQCEVAMVCSCHRDTLGSSQTSGRILDLEAAVRDAQDLRRRLEGDSGVWIVVRPVVEEAKPMRKWIHLQRDDLDLDLFLEVNEDARTPFLGFGVSGPDVTVVAKESVHVTGYRIVVTSSGAMAKGEVDVFLSPEWTLTFQGVSLE